MNYLQKFIVESCKDQMKIVGHVRGYQDCLGKLQLHRLRQTVANRILEEKEHEASEATKQLKGLKVSYNCDPHQAKVKAGYTLSDVSLILTRNQVVKKKQREGMSKGSFKG